MNAASYRFGSPRYRKVAALATLIIAAYVGAVGRGESLLWVIAALLSATLLTGIAWPHWLVTRLSVRRTGPLRANEGETIVFRVVVENRGHLPRFMVELMDRLPFVGAADGTATAGDRVLGVVAYVAGGARPVFEVPLLCEKRGFYRLGPVSLASSFPLGLAQAQQRRNDGVQTLTIYPEVFPIVSLPLHGTPSQIHRGGFLLPEAAGAAEFCGLREYRRGDNPRHIHWPTSARLSELMIREFEPMASACLCLALDYATDANVGSGRHSTFEYAIKIAASVAQHACNNGMPIRMMAHGREPVTLPAGSGDNHYRSLLEALAVADSDGAVPYARLLDGVALSGEPGETVVVFIAEPEARQNQTLQALAALRARGAHILAVLFDRSTFVPADGAHRPAGQTAEAMLLELGAACLQVRRGDDLFQLFNP